MGKRWHKKDISKLANLYYHDLGPATHSEKLCTDRISWIFRPIRICCLFVIVFFLSENNPIGCKIRESSGFVVSESVVGSGEEINVIPVLIPILFS